MHPPIENPSIHPLHQPPLREMLCAAARKHPREYVGWAVGGLLDIGIEAESHITRNISAAVSPYAITRQPGDRACGYIIHVRSWPSKYAFPILRHHASTPAPADSRVWSAATDRWNAVVHEQAGRPYQFLAAERQPRSARNLVLLSPGDPVLTGRRILRAALVASARKAGAVEMHAAAIADEVGRVLVFVGDKGAGKTSILLDALADGWRPVSNDRVLFLPQGLACGLPVAVGIRPDTALRHSPLSEYFRNIPEYDQHRPDAPGSRLSLPISDLAAAFGSQATYGGHVVGIALLNRSRRRRLSASPPIAKRLPRTRGIQLLTEHCVSDALDRNQPYLDALIYREGDTGSQPSSLGSLLGDKLGLWSLRYNNGEGALALRSFAREIGVNFEGVAK